MAFRNRSAHLARVFPTVFVLLCAVLLWPAAVSAQHTSPLCAEKSATVVQGASITLDVSDCASSPAFYGLGPVDGPALPQHGTASTREAGGRWLLDYGHDGLSTDSDVVEFTDGEMSGNGGTVRVTITVTPANSTIVIAPAALSLTAGTPISQPLSASGGTDPYTYAVVAGALPPGLSLNAATISGAPTQRGAYSFTVRATDNTGATADKAYSGTVANPSLSLSPASATAIQGVAFSHTLATAGGVAPYTYALEGSTLPTGLTLGSGGVISGTTSVSPGSYPVNIRVTDSSTGPGSYFEVESFTLTVSPPPSVRISVSPASVSEDGATPLVYTVTRSLVLSSPTVVNLGTGGTATSGVDYTGAVSSVTIPAGAAAATVVIDPIADTTVEADETVIITVAAGSGYTVGSPSSATGTILNDDVPSVSIAVSPTSVVEDSGNALVYTFTLDRPNPSALPVNFTVGGTAVNGTDYATIASPLSIPAGATTGTITVTPLADTTIEADKTVVLSLAAGTGYAVGAPAAATGTIVDDDQPTLSINDVSLNEGNSGTTSFTFTVSLSAPAGAAGVSFDIATADGTALAGRDYVAQALTGQVIAAGSSSLSFTVLVLGNLLNEPDKTFFVNVSNVTGATVVDGQGAGTIVNDDPLPTLSINNVAVTEGNAGTVAATLTVALSAASGQTVTVNYATADGTATAPTDYVSSSGTLTFPRGVTTQTIAVLVNGDTTPEADETFTVNLSAPVNALLGTAQGVVTILNDDQPVVVSPTTLPNPMVGAAYSQTLSASGGSGSYTYAITSGALPPGLTLASGGVLSGTPTATGSYPFTLTATDTSLAPGPYSGIQNYILTVSAPALVLAGPPLPGATLAQAYSASVGTAGGGTAPYTYVVSSGSVPPGLLLATNGTLSGTPTTLGDFTFDVTATDSTTGVGAPYSVTRTMSINVAVALPVAGDASLVVAYAAPATPVALALSGGAAASVAIDTAPQHGTATVTGATAISYQPAAGFAGTDSFTYTASNSTGTSAPATVTITVGDPSITVTATGVFSAVAGAPYSQTFRWTGGAAPYTGFQVSNLPAGLSITDSTADSVTVSGTPTQAGSFNLLASATDSSAGNGPFTTAQAFALAVASPTLVVTPATLPDATAGVSYQQAISTAGGVAPYTYALSGTLPTGMVFDAAAGTLSGTPTQSGSFTLGLLVTDSTTGIPATYTQSYTLQVGSQPVVLTPAAGALPQAVAGTAYQQGFASAGGVAPYRYTVSAGSLPAGMVLDASSGQLSGTSMVAGDSSFSITVTDSDTGIPGVVTQAYTLSVRAPAIVLAPGTLASGMAGAAFEQTFTASGGIAPYRYTIPAGSLPAGVSLENTTGVLSGTPTQAGSFVLAVTATDSTGGTAATVTQTYTLQIAAPAVLLTPTAGALPAVEAGTAYTQTFSASGGIAPYTYAVSAGALPAGLVLDAASGQLSGTSMVAGTSSFSITVTDSTTGTPGVATQAYSLTVQAPVIVLAPATLASGTAGVAFEQAFAASGGITPYRYTITAGTLPTGLSFESTTGVLSGTPTQAGSFALAVTVTDSTGGTAATVTRSYTLQIAAPAVLMTPAAGALPAVAAGTAYTQVFSASGGIAPYTYAVSAGALPAGLVLDAASGRLSGTATAAGSSSFSITVTDSTTGAPGVVTQAYSLSVQAPELTLTPATLPAGVYGADYQLVLSTRGGTAPYRYAVTAGSLPTGLVLDDGGQLSGTPAAGGAFSLTITATDALGFTGQRVYQLQIALRADPTRDAEVRGLLDAQTDAARRFASSQIENFQQRMQRLHGASRNGGFSNTLSLAASRRSCDSRIGQRNVPGCDPQRRQPFDDEDTADTALAGSSQDSGSTLGLWTGGSLRSGRTRSGGAAGADFQTDGLTLGADYRLSDAFAVGAGIGYGRDRSDVGQLGSRSDGQAYTLAVYGSYSPGQRVFVDMLLGHQLLDYTLRRYVTADGTYAQGRRDGRQWFGSLALGADFARGSWQFTPYARLDASHGTLDAFIEQGSALFALGYADQRVQTTTGNAGLRLETRQTADWGRWTPQLRVEYQHDFKGAGVASMQYADALDLPFYRTTLEGFERNRWLLGAGLQFELRRQWGLRVDYRGLVGSDDRDHGVQISVDKQL